MLRSASRCHRLLASASSASSSSSVSASSAASRSFSTRSSSSSSSLRSSSSSSFSRPALALSAPQVSVLSRLFSSAAHPASSVNDPKYKKYVELKAGQKLVVLGFGAIGQGILSLLYRHIGMKRKDQIVIISNEWSDKQKALASEYGAQIVTSKLTINEYQKALNDNVKNGDFLVNVSIDVSSVALIEHCQRVGALYIDSCNEPWAGGYSDPNKSAAARSNYAFREQALELKRSHRANGPTALITHGANPGIVSHFVKKALLDIAKDTNTPHSKPKTQAEWAELADKLGIQSIHISEKDTQASRVIKHDQEFVNTWSIEGLVEEGKQPAELGWGTHEKVFPKDGRRHADGCDAAIFLDRPGALTRVRTWAPNAGSFHGWLITHTEAISIADYFTKKDDKSGKVLYRPTVHFAYHPCADAVLSMFEVSGREWIRQPVERVMMDELESGRDELGVLLMGHKKNAYWYGSNLTVQEARRVAPNNNATSLQVCTSVLSGIVWAMENPNRGIIEPEEIEFDRCLEIAAPYLGELVGQYTDWTPLKRRNLLFKEELDQQSPFQFNNFRVW